MFPQMRNLFHFSELPLCGTWDPRRWSGTPRTLRSGVSRPTGVPAPRDTRSPYLNEFFDGLSDVSRRASRGTHPTTCPCPLSPAYRGGAWSRVGLLARCREVTLRLPDRGRGFDSPAAPQAGPRAGLDYSTAPLIRRPRRAPWGRGGPYTGTGPGKEVMSAPKWTFVVLGQRPIRGQPNGLSLCPLLRELRWKALRTLQSIGLVPVVGARWRPVGAPDPGLPVGGAPAVGFTSRTGSHG